MSTVVPDGPYKVFIGGLPTYLSEDQVGLHPHMLPGTGRGSGGRGEEGNWARSVRENERERGERMKSGREEGCEGILQWCLTAQLCM